MNFIRNFPASTKIMYFFLLFMWQITLINFSYVELSLWSGNKFYLFLMYFLNVRVGFRYTIFRIFASVFIKEMSLIFFTELFSPGFGIKIIPLYLHFELEGFLSFSTLWKSLYKTGINCSLKVC